MTSTPDEPRLPETLPPAAGLFAAIRSVGVVRPDEGRLVAGVALGVARRYRLDPLAPRLAFVVLTLFGGLGVALYGLGWLFLPHPDGRSHAQGVLGGRLTAGAVGALVVTAVGLPHLLPLLVMSLVGYLAVRVLRRQGEPAPAPSGLRVTVDFSGSPGRPTSRRTNYHVADRA